MKGNIMSKMDKATRARHDVELFRKYLDSTDFDCFDLSNTTYVKDGVFDTTITEDVTFGIRRFVKGDKVRIAQVPKHGFLIELSD